MQETSTISSDGSHRAEPADRRLLIDGRLLETDADVSFY